VFYIRMHYLAAAASFNARSAVGVGNSIFDALRRRKVFVVDIRYHSVLRCADALLHTCYTLSGGKKNTPIRK
jgi:hypothetical protein